MKVIIADDEPLARQRLRTLLQQQADVELLAEVGDGQAVLKACDELAPDVILLDIAMPGLDGLGAARELAGRDRPPVVIFCTAYDAHALSAFELSAADYLVKPVRAERLQAALDKARALRIGRSRETPAGQAPTARRTHLCARMRGNLRLIPLQDVRYLQAEERYVVVHHAHGEDLIEEPLKSLESEFPDLFLRIHRNCLVARSEVAGIRRGSDGVAHVVLRNEPDTWLEVSRRSLPQVREVLRRL